MELKLFQLRSRIARIKEFLSATKIFDEKNSEVGLPFAHQTKAKEDYQVLLNQHSVINRANQQFIPDSLSRLPSPIRPQHGVTSIG